MVFCVVFDNKLPSMPQKADPSLKVNECVDVMYRRTETPTKQGDIETWGVLCDS